MSRNDPLATVRTFQGGAAEDFYSGGYDGVNIRNYTGRRKREDIINRNGNYNLEF